ncbi:MAG: hypothetical protein GZ090_04305 [Oxalobacteraceae bacterium]|nr:hypothetical protein [Oxalobacteraceae bacterium]
MPAKPCSDWCVAVLYKLLFLGLSFEFSSIGLLFVGSHSAALIGSYLLLHALGCALLALVLMLLIPARYRRPRGWVLAYLFAFNFFMPIVGLVCVTGGLLLGFWLPRTSGKEPFEMAGQLRFTTHRNHEGTGFRGGQVRAQLGNNQAPLDQRLKALVAVQDTPARATGSLLRTLLADPADDMRLLAYGILDGKEKQITHRILESRRRLDQADQPADRFGLNKLVAELYWELIYQDLVQGDMRTFSAGQVRKYAVQALQLRTDDAGVWFLLTRLELFSGDVDAAERALAEARKNNFARERLLPYLAELRFLQHRYDEVRALFDELADQPGVPALAQSRRYWRPELPRAPIYLLPEGGRT